MNNAVGPKQAPSLFRYTNESDDDDCHPIAKTRCRVDLATESLHHEETQISRR